MVRQHCMQLHVIDGLLIVSCSIRTKRSGSFASWAFLHPRGRRNGRRTATASWMSCCCISWRQLRSRTKQSASGAARSWAASWISFMRTQIFHRYITHSKLLATCRTWNSVLLSTWHEKPGPEAPSFAAHLEIWQASSDAERGRGADHR